MFITAVVAQPRVPSAWLFRTSVSRRLDATCLRPILPRSSPFALAKIGKIKFVASFFVVENTLPSISFGPFMPLFLRKITEFGEASKMIITVIN